MQNEIERIEKKMAKLSPDSRAYFIYSDVLRELNPKRQVVLHQDPGDNLCDGCQ